MTLPFYKYSNFVTKKEDYGWIAFTIVPPVLGCCICCIPHIILGIIFFKKKNQRRKTTYNGQQNLASNSDVEQRVIVNTLIFSVNSNLNSDRDLPPYDSILPLNDISKKNVSNKKARLDSAVSSNNPNYHQKHGRSDSFSDNFSDNKDDLPSYHSIKTIRQQDYNDWDL